MTTVFGISQTSGVERQLCVERGNEGIVLTFKNHDDGTNLEQIQVQPDDLLPTITDPTPGGSSIEGVSPTHGWKMLLEVEIRRNEVWLTTRPSTSLENTDVAVGFDDFQDALEGAIG